MVHRDLLAVQFRLEEFAMHADPLRGLARNPEQIRIVIPEYDLDPPRKPRQQIHHERRAQIAAADQHLRRGAHVLDGRRQIPTVVADVRNYLIVYGAILRCLLHEPRPCYPAAAMLPPAAVRERFPLEIPHASKRPFPPASLDTSARKRRRSKRVARSK